jgi:hypothetical protein
MYEPFDSDTFRDNALFFFPEEIVPFAGWASGLGTPAADDPLLVSSSDEDPPSTENAGLTIRSCFSRESIHASLFRKDLNKYYEN